MPHDGSLTATILELERRVDHLHRRLQDVEHFPRSKSDYIDSLHRDVAAYRTEMKALRKKVKQYERAVHMIDAAVSAVRIQSDPTDKSSSPQKGTDDDG